MAAERTCTSIVNVRFVRGGPCGALTQRRGLDLGVSSGRWLSTDPLAAIGNCTTSHESVPMRTPEPWTPPATPFTFSNAATRGVSRRQLQTALTSGRITRLRHGVFIASDAVPEDPVAPHVLRALAEQVAAPGRVASHETAASSIRAPA